MRTVIFVLKYFRFWISAKSKYSIHSPFVYELLTNVIKHNILNSQFSEIEKLRKNLLNSHSKIEVGDLGAGSKLRYLNVRKIKDITKKYSKTPKHCELLFKLVNHFQPEIMLELGTSFGFSTMYQAIAAPQGEISTIEGCLNTAKIADSNFI
ncbi:MAG: hypothetical protein H8E98_08440 [Bacteroidetes bacterium]|nr:hypothetical protein [Bacteroidota bacterium]